MEDFEVIIDGKSFTCMEFAKPYGRFNIPEEIESILAGKPIEEQIEYFQVAETSERYRTYYGETEDGDISRYSQPLKGYSRVKKLIVQDGILIGAVIRTWTDDAPMYLGSGATLYYDYDQDGSGRNETAEYAQLLFRK